MRRTGALNIEIPAIVSDHRDFESPAETYGVEGHAAVRHDGGGAGFRPRPRRIRTRASSWTRCPAPATGWNCAPETRAARPSPWWIRSPAPCGSPFWATTSGSVRPCSRTTGGRPGWPSRSRRTSPEALAKVRGSRRSVSGAMPLLVQSPNRSSRARRHRSVSAIWLNVNTCRPATPAEGAVSASALRASSRSGE